MSNPPFPVMVCIFLTKSSAQNAQQNFSAANEGREALSTQTLPGLFWYIAPVGIQKRRPGWGTAFG
jgi:hypothetical protein